MYKKILLSTLLSFIAVALTACGGSNGDDKTPNQTAGSFKINGAFPNLPSESTWEIIASPLTDSCGEYIDSYYEFNFQYLPSANEIHISISGRESTAKEIVLQANGRDSVTLSGKIDEDDGTTVFNDLIINFTHGDTFEVDDSEVAGSVSWFWNDGEYSCEGNSTISGTLISVDKTPVDTPDPIDIPEGDLGSLTYNIGEFTGTTTIEVAGSEPYFYFYTSGYNGGPVYDTNVTYAEGLSVYIMPFSGSGNYSNQGIDDQNNSIYAAFYRVDWGNYYKTFNVDEITYTICISPEDEDNPNDDAYLTASINQSGSQTTGTISGYLNCYTEDNLNADRKYIGIKNVSLQFSLDDTETQSKK